ncbi:hypothetical protein G7Y79_00002g005000 [Physcia stellaris]|nr:hypothetical protein G7Y79_00002g005000 [Physcia stellaris]
MNGSMIDTSSSSPSSYPDTITNIVFGLCALAVGIVTIWQARRALRRRYIAHHGNSLDEENQAHPAVNYELRDITSNSQEAQEDVESPASFSDDPTASMTPSGIEDTLPGDDLVVSGASSTLAETIGVVGHQGVSRPGTPDGGEHPSSLAQVPLLSGTRPVPERSIFGTE